MVLMKNGKMKEALLVLEETYIDPYVIANTIPEEDFNVSNEDTLAIKDIPSRFMDAIQSVSSYEKNKKKIIKIDKNEAPQKLEKVNNQNIHIIVGSFSDKKNAQIS